MSNGLEFRLSGSATPADSQAMLEEICEHFTEHAEVVRTQDGVTLRSFIGDAHIREYDGRLDILLECPSQAALDMCRAVIAEHLVFFAGEEPLELVWSEPGRTGPLADIHPVTVVSSHEVTPMMRRVTFACADVSPFSGGGLHVRLLVPPQGREPVWPVRRADGRIGWPEGEDALLVRVYTIRSVDAANGHLLVDFYQHQSAHAHAPGAAFAADATPGQAVALMGPGGGGMPEASSMLLLGDETALPAILRIAEEAPAGTKIIAVIEVANVAEEQTVESAAMLDLRWLHRNSYAPGRQQALLEAARALVGEKPEFVWAGCEQAEVRAIRQLLKEHGYPKERIYAAAFWQKAKE